MVETMRNMFEDFPEGLKSRQGRKNLLGIRVYFDFSWRQVFPSNMVQFKGGKSLARLVKRDCPSNKMPALLLTTKEGVNERGFETETHYVLPICIPRYLSQRHAEQADTYFAQSVPVTRPQIQQALQDDPELAKEIVQKHLDEEKIRRWATSSDENLKLLREIASVEIVPEVSSKPIAIEDLISTIDAMKTINPKLLSAIGELLARAQDPEAQSELIESLTRDENGRAAMAQISASKLSERISDARNTLEKYKKLLNDPDAKETDLQEFLEEHPWLLGLDYIRVRPRKTVIRGQNDFILERYDGTLDILELKGPNDDIIQAPDIDSEGCPPSASKFNLCPAFANALAQIHVYKDSFDENPSTFEQMYGLKHTRHPRLIIVIGRGSSLPKHRKRVLEQMNRSLHRVEILPYDAIADRAEANLNNLEQLMTIGHESEGDADQKQGLNQQPTNTSSDMDARKIEDNLFFDVPDTPEDKIPF